MISGFYYDEQVGNPMFRCALYANTKYVNDVIPYTVLVSSKNIKETTDDSGKTTYKYVKETKANSNQDTKAASQTTEEYVIDSKKVEDVPLLKYKKVEIDKDQYIGSKFYKEKRGKWVTWSKGGGKVETGDDYSEPRGGTNHGENYSYGTEPICESIITDDLQVAVGNSWSEFGADMIGNLWNSQIRPMAPYVEETNQILEDMKRGLSDFVKDTDENSNSTFDKIARFINNKSNNFLEFKKENTDFMHKALVVNGTRFTYYGGTNVDFGGNLSMRFTLFSGYNRVGNNIVWESVVSKVEKILPYVIGVFQPIAGVSEEIASYASWQDPPGGFKANLIDIDNINFGTLKLKIGNVYAIENLVIGSAQFTFSKTLCKVPSLTVDFASDNGKGTDNDRFIPAFCDVTLNLQPATKYSRTSLERFVNGTATSRGRETTNGDMENSLDSVNKILNENTEVKPNEFFKYV